MKNKVINTSIIIMAFTIISKVIAMLRDALMASAYGVEMENATFIFAMRTTMLLVSIGYGLTMAVIPIHSKLMVQGDKNKSNKFINNIISISVIVSMIIAILGIVFANPIVKILSKDIAANPVALSQAVLLIRIMFLSLIFVGPQNIMAGVLQCHERFLIPASMALWSNVIYLGYQLILLKYFGIIGYGVAVVIAFFVMMAVNIPTFKKLGYKFKFFVNLKDENIKALGRNIVPIVISSSLVQINLSILTNIAGSIESSSIVILDYGNKMTTMFYEVFAIGINMVTYPILAGLQANRKMEEYNEALIKSINYILILLLPVSIGLFILRVPIMALYLLRGEFTVDLVVRVATFLAFLTPSIIALSLKDMLSRCYFSLDNQKEVLKNSVFTIIILFVITITLKTAIGEESLAIGYTLTSIITLIMLYIPLKREIKFKYSNTDINNIIKMILSSLIMGIIVLIINKYFWSYNELNSLNSLIIIAISGVVGIIVYGVSLVILKVNEVKDLSKLVKKFKGAK
ncbi:MAG: murein biosynthesis integral membrane protein MurJ [Clostridium sp.]